MNLAHQFQNLLHKQLAIREGIALLKQAQADLLRNKAAADRWGMVAVVANAVLIPLNCIINAFDLKAVNSLYQSLSRELYNEFSKSGTRMEGREKVVLAAIKREAVAVLTSKGLKDFVPGVNILVGLAEDTSALFETMAKVSGRDLEIAVASVQQKIHAMEHELTRLGMKAAEILPQLEKLNRVA